MQAQGWRITRRVAAKATLLFFFSLTASTGSSGQSISIVGQRSVCFGGKASGYDCSESDLMSVLTPADLGAGETCGSGNRRCKLNDVWGWSDPSTNREFAIVGREDGTAFVEVTDPLNPVYIGALPYNGSGPDVWRDMKTFRHYVYIVADGRAGNGMQIFDLHELYDFAGTPLLFQTTAEYHEFGPAHNIAIDRDTGFAYVVGARSFGQTCGGGFHMISLADPVNPTFAGCFSYSNTGRSNTGYTHDVQCVVYHGPDTDYQGHEICVGSNETHIVIADVTDKNAPVEVSKATYPFAGYVHQGWLTEDQAYFLQDDELDESRDAEVSHTRTLIWDLADLDDPVLLTQYYGIGTSTDHNLYVKGSYAYQSNYIDGLHILDISDIGNPFDVASFDTHPGNLSTWDGSWSNYPFFNSGAVGVTSSVDGFFMIQPTAPGMSVEVERNDVPTEFVTASAFPNPFSDHLTVTVDAGKAQPVRIQLFDLLGRQVATLFDGVVGNGEQRIESDVPDLPDGHYVFRISGEGFTVSRPLVRVHP